MPACPNCGRQTQRTKDWACQWCGYPLISRAFKKIDKTFKELQEERNLSPRYEEAETDVAPETDEVEEEVQLQPEPQPRPKHRFFHRESKPQPEPEPEKQQALPQPVMRQETKTEPSPKVELKKQPEQAPRIDTRPRPSPPTSQHPDLQPRLEPKAESAPEPKPIPTLPPRPVSMPEPEPAPVSVIPLDSIKEGMEITVDQLNALFKAEKSGAHTRFTGKVFVVRGIVEKIFIREHLEIRYIVLTGTQKKELWSVRCSFEKEGATGLNRLNEGQETAVRGKYDGYGKNILFKNCSLV